MKAIVFEKFQGQLSLEKVPDPVAKDDGVVIQVTATGLCRSDWHGWMGHDPDIVLPHVPGHELAGIIEAKGKNVKKFQIGDRVTLPFVNLKLFNVFAFSFDNTCQLMSWDVG